MRMISYAFNREDVLLDRLFRDMNEGFYIDVGAGHPTRGSLTRHFYERGWRGVNIEPSPSLFETLESERPEDINLQMAVSDTAGMVEFYKFDDRNWGLSTLSPDQRDRHADSGLQYETQHVPTATLAEICEQHATGEIQFMSIDVEGYEAQVVSSGDWRRWRPRVMVIEATEPLTQLQSHHVWEPSLLEADYLFAYFDGLNRFYVRAEDAHLIDCFKTPVNLFDDALPYEMKSYFDELSAQLQSARAVNDDLRKSESALLADHQYFRDRLARIEEELRRLSAKVAESVEPGAPPPPNPDPLGPLGMAIVRRVADESRRYPRLAEAARRTIRLGLKLKAGLRTPKVGGSSREDGG